jgi:hypothetical protein
MHWQQVSVRRPDGIEVDRNGSEKGVRPIWQGRFRVSDGSLLNHAPSPNPKRC